MADILTVDKGSTILIQAEFLKSNPFTEDTAFDPSSPQITVTDPDGTVQVNGASMSNQGVGQWYYYIQTTTAWINGLYNVKVVASYGGYSDITIHRSSFRLI